MYESLAALTFSQCLSATIFPDHCELVADVGFRPGAEPLAGGGSGEIDQRDVDLLADCGPDPPRTAPGSAARL